ncbi:MAG: hybrid sensor histidine kinase/response regulator [Leptolyngbya foveolarum]|uniref:histidine kinase n=1 Tax=Leptolyngbya foveolarum TaxID=47253 RepID=A0A2W4W6L5_9CYAN|nr:MAG: hybrid sensor histidine kinase/response regulator [Leptolyngbya foveolarum]
MPTIESLTAYQSLSPAVYIRLRETLVCQSHLFDWTVTESDMAHHPNSSASYDDADSRLDSTGSTSAFWSAWQSGTSQFVLMGSKAWCLLLTAEAIDSGLPDGELTGDLADVQAYRVGLTFDDWAIAQFALHLKEMLAHSTGDIFPSNTALFLPKVLASLSGIRGYPMQTATDLEPLLNQVHLTPEQASRHSLHAHSINPRSQCQYLQNSQNLQNQHPSPKSSSSYFPPSGYRSISTDEKLLMAQETFMLNWAKQMSASPDLAAQRSADTLQTQMQQSLLLNQVVTRIRHSLDLSDILETTVAQVRSFLAADRLLLYQFDKSSPTANRSIETAHVGRAVFSGHVTYEARASEAITSVLRSAEKGCFTPSQLQRAKFLSGRPIAVDSVDEQYAHSPCLLKFLKKAQVKSKIIAPVVVQGELWGLLIAHQCHDYRQWEETEVVFLQHIAEHLAVAVNQAQLYAQLQQQTTSLESCVVERTQNLHDALMAAETANVTKGEFLSTMSHELRTPLTYIIGMSATLLRWSFGELSDRQRSYLDTIHQSGEQLLGIINSILEFAKVEAGQRLLDASEVSLSALFGEAIAHYRELAQKRGVQLSLDSKLKPAEDLFWADEKRLQQVVANLTENAIKFTPEGGKVSLMIWRESQQVVFQVEDTGIGIADSQRDGLFEKFKQLESPFQRQYSGTGLGLAMTKHLVEMHGGTIQVESKVDQGSTFTVRLPKQPKPQHSVHSDISSTFASTKRIILLERDEESAAIICNMLTAAGYEVIWLLEATPLAAQLELLKPMLLIANLALLNQDASEIKSLQLSITTLEAKVLALLEPEPAPLPMAHHDVLAKPINPKVLLEKVRQLSPVLP